MSNIESIETIIREIDRINSFGDDRVLILYCSLFIEGYVEELYSVAKGKQIYENCKCCGKSLKPGFLKKVKELTGLEYINKEVGHDNIIKEIWKHRGPAVHEINLDTDKIIAAVEEYTNSSKKEDPYGKIAKLLSNITWQKKLEMPTIAIAFSLRQTLNNRLGIPITQKLEFEIDPACTSIKAKIINLSSV